MRLIKFESPDGPIHINPDHVVAVRKGMRDTKVETICGPLVVSESVEVVARLLGADEIPRDITPALTKAIDL
ncbi:MAG: hypothetical protein HY834_03335 [Devosia nanyangense]|uniref:Uncharacterized protein n=1 Tax=Devosia nanyangense TaxID=1228055 RepID=A0A933L1D1_9HYPH|nr:hypothetical protein [Devosia nanyangense]